MAQLSTSWGNFVDELPMDLVLGVTINKSMVIRVDRPINTIK